MELCSYFTICNDPLSSCLVWNWVKIAKRGTMPDIRPLTGKKRLKSLDEFDRKPWKWDTLPKQSISAFWFILIGLILGGAIGFFLV